MKRDASAGLYSSEPPIGSQVAGPLRPPNLKECEISSEKSGCGEIGAVSRRQIESPSEVAA